MTTVSGRSPSGQATRASTEPQEGLGHSASVLNALAERCQKAARPDRELDCLIHCEIKGWVVVYEGVNVFADMGPTMRRMLVGWLDPGVVQRNFSMTSDSLAPNYTASLDAALTLVPEGYYPLLDTWFDRKSATLRHDSRRPHIEGLGDTLALALCAAALKARAASGIETEGQDGETRLGAEHESPTVEDGDAQ